MADAFDLERQKVRKIDDQESGEEVLEFSGAENPRNTSSWKSASATFSNREDNVGRICTLTHGSVTTDEHNESDKQKIGFVPYKKDENMAIFFGKVEHETDLELTIVSPINGASKSGTSSSNGVEASKEIHEPDDCSSSLEEPISRLSRIDSAKQDIRNLKSATLGRMGKMFKLRPPTPSANDKTSSKTEKGLDSALATAEEQYCDNPTRKEKTHSLGRMLRLIDKDGAPRKLFSHTRTGSLTRSRKTLQSTVGNATPPNSSEESRNIFTRMINQFRGRNSAAANAEPNLQSINEPAAGSQKPSLGTRLMMSLSSRGVPTSDQAETESSTERVTVDYTA